MEMSDAPRCFAALSHEGRLAVFRLLMRMAPQGARPTDMAQTLSLKQNTLSHHLAGLEAAGLILAERQGRSILYRADMAALAGLMAYVGLDLGRGRPDLAQPFSGGDGLTLGARQGGFNVLFLCSGNSARSIFAEALLRDLGRGRFNAHSAGTRPNAEVNPFARQVLARNGHALAGLRPKPVDVFRDDAAPVMDFVFTVCDTAAGEECPPWAGQPITGHWGLPDPVKAEGTEAERALAFAQSYAALRRRIGAFVALPMNSLNRLSLQAAVDAIGEEAARPEGRKDP
ncbi:metalloregulator ArsR/SmtB family transcription factor [Paragemmobacter straminiformis]|uniref:Metalloregulator ArsR/SmtB family transcription factor n=1 Tax=Paragemmobacter straminiformis TaxID=2045119 RepID=A0A842ID02_9RHOB|nr:metalloregulator ArsR/SmtB family transcription factor [Gemmobacter straminiformis]MBC2837429.1 metalloregulator ArsR/SmtB family transcription factor [Gemmobacter straminiformis]